jgi:hypothetical protein
MIVEGEHWAYLTKEAVRVHPAGLWRTISVLRLLLSTNMQGLDIPL